MSYGAMGNDAVFMQAESFGVGLLPLDDVFQTHVITTQAALKRYPRGPAAGCASRGARSASAPGRAG